MNPDPRQLWLAFGDTMTQELRPHGGRYLVGAVSVSAATLQSWRDAGWIEPAPYAYMLDLTEEGRAQTRRRWTE